jgi:hypothetical protein
VTKKTAKNKKPLPPPPQNRQIPNSLVRKATALSAVPNQHLQHAREYPLYGCWIMSGWQESGITPVVVAREQEPGRIMFGVYMMDLYCMGIKDVYTKTDYSLSRFERDLPEFCARAPEACSVELAHEVIYGGLEYAEKLGFQPHPDFTKQMADLMLDPPDAHPRVDQVVFGKDGQPFYITGPYDSQQKITSILNTLKRTCGEGNFHYMIGFGEPSD